MPAAPLLSSDQIRAALAELPGWELRDERLVKQFRCADFKAALAFVQRVAQPAAEIDHHPDVFIHWREVTLSLWTHAAGGITGRDLRLARAIEQLDQAR
ncbi:4a-hydroxytetrahydrobiopterin dehydratase [soil metagenome]